MKNEQNLLIELLNNKSGNGVTPLLKENINWEYFRQITANHRITPLVFNSLRRFSAFIDFETFAELQKSAEKIAFKNLEYNARLLRLAKLFEENNIEFIAYKGGTLAQMAYGESALRQFGDLDFLIDKKDFSRVKKIIIENGGHPAWKLTEKQEKAVLKHYYEFSFVFGEKRLLVEIHWSFMESFFGFDYESPEAFRRSQKVSIHGRKIRTLSNEDLLLVLCVHGSKHFWKRLSWICDVGKLVENQTIDWDVVIKLARDYGCRRMLDLGLSLAEDFLKIGLPAEIEQRIEQDKEIKSLTETLKKHLFDDAYSAETVRPQLHLKMRERWRDKFTYSRRLFTTKLVDSLFMPMGRPR